MRAEAVWLTLGGADVGQASGRTRRQMMAAGLAAGVALAGAGTWLSIDRRQVYVTAVGQRRSVRLNDGSTMLLNTASRSNVAISEERRRVEIEGGEAWFQVAHDAGRPFVVSAGDIRAEAVGTAFAVRRTPDGAEVIVTEGRVRAWSEANPSRFITLAAGQRATVPRMAGADAPTPVGNGVEDALAWRQDEIVLDGMTLGDAAAEFNRYNARQLAVEASLADRRIVGRFRTGDIDGFARAAATIAGGRVESGERRIRITQ